MRALMLFFTMVTAVSSQAQKLLKKNGYDRLIPSIVLAKDTGKTFSLEERMKFYHVQGMSMERFENGTVTYKQTWGFADSKKHEYVNSGTRFQVASISKAVTALGVLKLALKYGLDLDQDIDHYLRSWHIPQTDPALEGVVSIRRLLNHTAGINVEGFEGYVRGQHIPSLLEVLNGSGTTPVIRVIAKPGTSFRYAGGGFVILAKLIEDVSGKSFEGFMQEEVFRPLGMHHSSFDQFPLQNASVGYDQDGVEVEGGWRIMPELAPNGLWTTAHDLAVFCMALQDAYLGKSNPIIPKAMAGQMFLRSDFMDYGLGLGLKFDETNQVFFHAGRNPGGFTAVMIGNMKHGSGLVVLVNSEDDHLLREIVNGYVKANKLGYARGLAGPQMIVKTTPLSDDELSAYAGRFQLKAEQELEVDIVKNDDGSLSMKYLYNGYTATLHPIRADVFFEVYTGLEIQFQRNKVSGKIESVERRGKVFLRK